MGIKWEDSKLNEYPLTCFKIQLRIEEIIPHPIELQNIAGQKVFK